MRQPFAIAPSASCPSSPTKEVATPLSSPDLRTHLPSAFRASPKSLSRCLRVRNCASGNSSPVSKATRESSQLSENSTLTQVGARAWAKSASGARMKPFISRTGTFRTQDPDRDWNVFLGYIGPQKPAIEPWLRDTSPSPPPPPPHPEEQLQGQCFKLSRVPYSESKDSIQRALLYLKLRADGCSKSQSIFYSKKRRCMFDSTRVKDGPSCHRTIRLGNNRSAGPNWNGWQLHSPKMEIGKKFQLVDLDSDLHEYETIAREFERLTHRQERIREEVDFYDADKDREKYFQGLQQEWEKREKKEREKAATHSSWPVLKAVITEEKTVTSDTSEGEKTAENDGTPRKPSLLTLLLPSIKVIPPAESEAATGKSTAGDLAACTIDPSKVDVFQSGSLVIRSVAPVRESAPTVIRKAGRRPTHECRKTFIDPPTTSMVRRRTFTAYSEFIKRMRSIHRKEQFSSAEIAKSELMLGLARMCEEVSRGQPSASSEEKPMLLPRKSKTFLNIPEMPAGGAQKS